MKREENIIAFGDIHGCFQALEKAVEIAKKLKAKVVFLGDYIDRGPDSIKTLDVLMKVKEENPDWVFLRGNHDQMLLDLIEEKAIPNSDGKLSNGHGFSYDRTTVTYNQLKEESKGFQKEVYEFLKNLKNHYENEYFIFLHAPLRDNSVALTKKSIEELTWNYSLDPIWVEKPFIHGHATVKTPKTVNKGTNINTECGYGGVLTGALLKNNKIVKFYSISESGQLI